MTTDDKVTAILTRVALSVALLVAIAFPLGYGIVAYRGFSGQLEFKARVKASALSGFIASAPETWIFAEHRLQGLLTRVPVALETESVEVYDARGDLVARAGTVPGAPALRRTYPVHDAARMAGRVEVSDSLRPMLLGTAAASLLGILLGGGVFLALRSFPLRALRGATSALFEQKQHAERLNRVYAVLSGINGAIVRIRERGELFREACRIAVSEGGFKVARIIELDARGWASLAATSGSDSSLFQRVLDHHNGDLAGSTSVISLLLQSGEPVIANDVANDLRFPNRAALTVDGNFALALLPILEGKRIAGALLLRTEEPGLFDTQELRLLSELVANLSFALESIDRQSQLEYLEYYDALTGLANRRLFLERVARHIRSAAADGHTLAIYLVDLERFKNINDTLGRPAGDDLLKQVSQWLTSHDGDAQLLARVGADIFATVVPRRIADGEGALRLENSIKAFMLHPFSLNGTTFRIAAKVGGAVYPEDGGTADILFRNAEAALKKAKASGARYLFHTPEMTEAAAGKLSLENQLREALEQEQFVLHYQPKVNLASGKMTSAEALIRWNDPRTGLVPPGRFIPVLEETGLIYDVGRWALRRAIKDYLRWRAAGLPAVRVSVNVSPLQLRNRGFIEEIREVIGVGADAAAGLELEITESLIMEDVRHSIACLEAIRAMGVTIAIDDFGTGFSSLSYLARLPVDTLKIDRSFVLDMTIAPEGLSLISTIINLAHSLKLKVVAEGVETEEQSRLLHLLSCDEMQGYLFSKPLPADEFEARFLAPAPAPAPALAAVA